MRERVAHGDHKTTYVENVRPRVRVAGTAREYMVRADGQALSAGEIRDVNTRYHDVAADHYDSKWGSTSARSASR